MANRRRERTGVRDDEAGRHDTSPGGHAAARDISDEAISARAYELYERRGREHGRDWDDWLEAERELQARRHTPGPTPS